MRILSPEEFQKRAEEQAQQKPVGFMRTVGRVARPVIHGGAGILAGGGAVLGAYYLADKIGIKPPPLKYALPIGAFMGGALEVYDEELRQEQLEEMRNAVKNYHDSRRPAGAV